MGECSGMSLETAAVFQRFAAYVRSRVSSWPDQRRVNRQHPAVGRLIIDGPGPPITLRPTSEPTLVDPIIRWALIRRSELELVGETQRILLL